MYSLILPSLITFIFLILAIAFFTLLERKVLGYAQIRKGPNKIGLAGLPQPLADALKLFLKSRTLPYYRNKTPYILAPCFSLVLALFLWSLYASPNPTFHFHLGLLFFLTVSSINVYGTLIAGWASNSKYSLLGALRALAQTISYEISMALILLIPLTLASSFNLLVLRQNQHSLPWALHLFPLLSIWFITTLAETNRAPFDFAEGESELVSGFNVEYSGTPFAFIFIAEYLNILFIRFLTRVLFFSSPSLSTLTNLLTWLKSLFIAFIFLWVRAALPRLRYDLLINLTWKIFLPTTLLLLLYYSNTHPLL